MLPFGMRARENEKRRDNFCAAENARDMRDAHRRMPEKKRGRD